MKGKVVTLALALLLLSALALSAGQREIDNFLRAFETIVVDAETLAKKNAVTVNDATAFGERTKSIEDEAKAIQKDRSWTPEQTERYNKLYTRYNTAMQTIASKMRY